MNVALGAKILWGLVSRKMSWWKEIILKKHIGGSRNFNFKEIHHPCGSPILKTILKIITLIKSTVSWFPKDGYLIQFWDNPILGNPPLKLNHTLYPLRRWCKAIVIFSLIFQSRGALKTCFGRTGLLLIPSHNLFFPFGINFFKAWKEKPQFQRIPKISLFGIPTLEITQSNRDIICFLEKITLLSLDIKWNKIWLTYSIPMMDLFFQLLSHGNLLTAKDLAKTRIIGPSRCPQCLSSEKTSVHLFFECPVSSLVSILLFF